MTSPYSIVLLRFNNYNNRILKKYDTLEEYITNVDFYYQKEVNFKFADGIMTKATLGTNENPLRTCDYDYLLVIKDNKIHSRWFIMEATYKSSIQYDISLKRDVLADFKDNFLHSKAIIQKATINDWGNPLIFNKENIDFNQIKKQEILLKDETRTNWIVGYIANNYAGGEKIDSINTRNEGIVDLSDIDVRLNDETNPNLGGYFDVFDNKQIEISIGFKLITSSAISWFYSLLQCKFDSLTSVESKIRAAGSQLQSALICSTLYARDNVSNFIRESYQSSILSNPLRNFLENSFDYKIVSNDEYDFINSLNGQKITFDNKYYYFNITGIDSLSKERYLSGEEDETQLLYSLKEISREAASKDGNLRYEDNDRAYRIKANVRRIKFTLIETTGPSQLSATIQSSRQHLIDAPYDMFCMKYNLSNLALATAIAEKLGDNIYDIQILPYCPARDILPSILNGTTQGIGNDRFTEIISEEEAVDYIYWCSSSSIRFNIAVYENIFDIPHNALDLKVKNETELFRIVSPNYNGAYEFSVAKNYGVDSFEISCTYKPISPYIQVSPTFKGLYGSNFNDGRGLICNGDFSMARISDQWTNYEINNKNYQNIFDTQIKTMDKNNAINLASQFIGSGLSAASTGLLAGSLMSSAGLGLGVGGVSAGAGLIDIGLSQIKYQNDRAMKIDIFNYQLGNIKARPDTLSKVSSINVNNKYFPFVEYYSSTDEEKEIFKTKLEWDGMTIMKIDSVENWINSKYIKGEILRIDISEDSHITSEIAMEFRKGVYLS